MNAIENLIEEIARIEKTIQVLIDRAFELQKLLSSLFILQIELVIPPEEKSEHPEKSPGASCEIMDYMITIGPVNIYSMAGAIGDTFEMFENQIAGIAGIFGPHGFSKESNISTLERIEIAGKESWDSREIVRGTEQYAGIETPEEKPVSYDKTETLYADLMKSALIIKEIGIIHESLAHLSIERERSPEISGILSETQGITLPGQKRAGSTTASIVRDFEKVFTAVRDFSEISENISTALNTKFSEAQEVAHVSFLRDIGINFPMSHGSSKVEQHRDASSVHNMIEISDTLKNFSEISENISEALAMKIYEAHKVTDVFALEKSSTPIPPVPTKSEVHPLIYSGQGIIEIPAFTPRSSPSGDAALNAVKLSGAIAGKSSIEKEARSFFRETPQETHQSMQVSFAPVASVSNAFENISQYITMANEIDNHMKEIMGSTQDGGNIPPSSVFNTLLSNENAGTVLTLDRIALGGNGNDAPEGIMNIAQSFAATEALQKAGSSTIRDIILAVPSSGSAYSGLPESSMPRSMENISQMFFGSQKEPASQSTSSTVDFHNTFNIEVHVRGGEEGELRDLGKKIGRILSDEIRRYGGIR